jgi:exodeoxyribonuclease III
MKLVTWNVNSLKVRLPHLLELLSTHQPDAVCLQETKLEDANFPHAQLAAAGYRASFCGQKTYNGVAILARSELSEVCPRIPGFDDEQKRVIAGCIGDVRLVCVYVPNGQSVSSDKYDYKLRWMAALREWLREELRRHPRLAVMGDFNVAPEDEDVFDPKQWQGKVLFSVPERAALQSILDVGLKDAFRLFEQPEKSFTWWDYRIINGFKRNLGLRIDHVLLSETLAQRCRACGIDLAPRRLERPSDHAPVIAELEL